MNGHINEDIFIYDIKRFQKFHSDKKFIMERVTETLGDLYGMHWPFKQHKTSRDQKLTPYHEEMKKAGACFGVSGGYERPMWYALKEKNQNTNTVHTIIKIGIQQLNLKLKNTRENVGLFDLSSFSKYDLKGNNVHYELQKICTANIKNDPGRTTYTQMLNQDGGIETDLTVVCLGKDYFRIITSASNRENMINFIF